MEHANAFETLSATVTRGAGLGECAKAEGFYHAKCYDKEGNLNWEAPIKNVVMNQGKAYIWNTMLTGSGFTAANYMGMIVSSTAIVTTGTDIMTSHAWTEASTTVCTTRATLTASWTPAGTTGTTNQIVLGTTASFTMAASSTIYGVFVVLQGATTPLATGGYLLSAGLFTAGKAVSPSDQLQISYSIAM